VRRGGDSGKTEAWAAKGEAQRERYGGEERRESPARLDRRRQAAGRESTKRRRGEETQRGGIGELSILFFPLTAEINGEEGLTVLIYINLISYANPLQIPCKFASELQRMCFRDSFRVLASGSKSCDGIARMTMQIRRKFERELRGNLAIPSQFRRNSIASCYILKKKKIQIQDNTA